MVELPKLLRHGMLLDAKRIMDNALPELAALDELVPVLLHERLVRVLARFEDTLCECDVANEYTEKTMTNNVNLLSAMLTETGLPL